MQSDVLVRVHGHAVDDASVGLRWSVHCRTHRARVRHRDQHDRKAKLMTKLNSNIRTAVTHER